MQQKALSGVTILDLTQYLSGPFFTMILGDLGATVIKVERPDRPLGAGPYLNGERIYDMSVNRSKKSITLNLKNPRERDIALQLAAKADIVAENFKPGVVEKMGLGYEDIRRVNPEVIYTAISGFGQTGPYRTKGAFDTVIQGISGLMSMTGEPDGPPTKVGMSIADVSTSFYATIATLAALHHKTVTGKGQYIDIAMLDSTFSLLENSVGMYLNTGIVPTRAGNRHRIAIPFQPFKTSDGELIIPATRDPAFYNLCRTLGLSHLINDPRFTTAEARRQHPDELEVEITRVTETMTMAELGAKLDAAGIPAGQINTIDRAVDNPQIQARNMIREYDHPIAGKYRMMGSPIKLSETPVDDTVPAPYLGQHTREILGSGMLGMSNEEIDALLAEQAKLKPGASTEE